jgi:uncharacterized 2Fe-2S/4Fe-4S cluster protein (DUF4445 family)
MSLFTVSFSVENTDKIKTVSVPAGTTILEAARIAGVVVESPCNGIGTCAKCGVKIRGAEVLSCRTPVSGDIDVLVRDYAENSSLKILSKGKRFPYTVDPFVVRKGPCFGVVIDIGTTTLAAVLADLHGGAELAGASALNPQSRYAQDVLSRIHFASGPGGLKTLQTVLMETLNEMTGNMAAEAGINREHIYEAALCGNTAMLHLACGIDPAPLGRFPYMPAIRGGGHVDGVSAGLGIAPGGVVYLPPVVSAYVGADISAGILAAELAERPGTTVFIDIGTNGEMVLARNGIMAAASTAAGPAFEGMNIRCGMRAGGGAVESFHIDEAGKPSFTVIGGGGAAGICGSGLLDLAGELVRTGIIGANGRFADSPAVGEKDGKRAFFLTGDVYLTQKDVRQIQLAKGAIRCGIEMLLARLDLKAGEVDSVVIAGSFGYHLNENSLVNIGLLPPEFAGKVEFAGNTSLSGGLALLLNKGLRKKIAALVTNIDKVELAGDPAFEKNFISCLNFEAPGEG